MFRRSRAAKVLSILSAAATTASGAADPGLDTGIATAWYSWSPTSLGSTHSPDVVFPSKARPIKAPREKSWSNKSRSEVQARSPPLGSVISTQSAPV